MLQCENKDCLKRYVVAMGKSAPVKWVSRSCVKSGPSVSKAVNISSPVGVFVCKLHCVNAQTSVVILKELVSLFWSTECVVEIVILKRMCNALLYVCFCAYLSHKSFSLWFSLAKKKSCCFAKKFLLMSHTMYYKDTKIM